MNTIEAIKQKNLTYLSFHIGNELFATHVAHVTNILEIPKITTIPKSPNYMRGVINLRGKVLPVVDIRLKFDLPGIEITRNTCIIVLEVEINGDLIELGIMVDSVKEVLEISEEKIEESPSLGKKYRSEIISGVANIKDNFIMILDMNQVFSLDEILEMGKSADKQPQNAD